MGNAEQEADERRAAGITIGNASVNQQATQAAREGDAELVRSIILQHLRTLSIDELQSRLTTADMSDQAGDNLDPR